MTMLRVASLSLLTALEIWLFALFETFPQQTTELEDVKFGAEEMAIYKQSPYNISSV
jgi:hypothetical protein